MTNAASALAAFRYCVAKGVPPAHHSRERGGHRAQRHRMFAANAERGEGHIGLAAAACQNGCAACLGEAARAHIYMSKIDEGFDARVGQIDAVAQFAEGLRRAGTIVAGQAVGEAGDGDRAFGGRRLSWNGLSPTELARSARLRPGE